jgi:hypothetical protein
MSKIYFIVGAVGNGTTIVTGELADSYRKNTQFAVIKPLGLPEKLKNAGTKSAAETLTKIETMIGNNSSADAVIFVGWRIPDHIDEIYAAHPSATYIFTKADADLHLSRYMKTTTSEEQMAGIRILQQADIDNFILDNSIALNWIKTSEPIFDDSRNINATESGDVSIAVLGTL